MSKTESYQWSLPKFIREILMTKFNVSEVKTIDANWYRFSNGCSFSNSSIAQILAEGKMVLSCSTASTKTLTTKTKVSNPMHDFIMRANTRARGARK